MSMASSEFDDQRWAHRASRLRWLVAVQLVLATAYAWTPLIPLLPWRGRDSLIWAAVGISQAPTALLAFWCALGTSRQAWRQIGGMLGIMYLAARSVLHTFVYDSTLHNTLPSLASDARHYSSVYVEQWISAAGVSAIFVGIFTGVLVVARHWLGELRYIEQPDDARSLAPTRTQFAIRHLMAATMLVAVVCGLSRGASIQWTWQGETQQGIGILALVAFLLVAARAALTPGPIRGRLWRATMICVLVSWTYTITSGTAGFDPAWWLKSWWWILLNSLASMGLPAGIIIVSLLVVRSCGYRLTKEP